MDRIGDYQILGVLGKGAHSTILHIRRRADGHSYALKVVPIDGADDQKFLDQAQHEFRVAQMLDHPNLVKIYCLETERDWLRRVKEVRLLIEYVAGKTLDTCPPLTLPQLVRVFARVADGMVHMHRRGIWHGDLKPNNIMVARTGEVKVIDYGLACVRGEPPRKRRQGTPQFMAPESARHGILNAQTDVYNFGATMYRLVTGRWPPQYASASGLPVVARSDECAYRPVAECRPDAPPVLADLLERCLAADPKRRPARMSEIQGALDRLADDLAAPHFSGS
ncbi:MAG: serine/threonine protein kinase [Gemmataceae bacterium]|nr:serine/threonine protein kinase [Gemmataceae bacterium]MDW8264296.1 serine/threonine-protein kinase [Gemmataceae bacterium]